MIINLETSVGKLKLKNPVLVASGTFGYGDEYRDVLTVNKLGGVITKTITMTSRDGNPPPRLAETPAGLLNSIGLQNVGIERFLKEKLPKLSFIKIPIIVSIAGDTVDEFAEVAARLNTAAGIAAVELNLSCPNIKNAGCVFADTPETVAETVTAVRNVFSKPLVAKLSPVVYDIVRCSRMACDAGADGVTVANTYPGMAIDSKTKTSRIGTMTGGLSGPAIRPLSVRLAWMAASQADVPVIGSGGIASLSDALEFLIAGARAVAVGTALYGNPKIPLQIREGLSAYMREHKETSLSALIGSIAWKH